jgi:glycerol-3-phosphate dehydrogenase
MKDLPKRHRLGVSRMAYRHGARAGAMLAQVQDDPRRACETCLCEPVLEAELRSTMQSQLVRRLVDVRRRTRQSMGACGGTRCLARTAEILVEEAGLDPVEHLVELQGAMDARFIGKRPVLEGANLATEELNQAIHFLTGNLAPAFRAAAVARGPVVADRGVPADAPATRVVDRVVDGSPAAAVIAVTPIPEGRT